MIGWVFRRRMMIQRQLLNTFSFWLWCVIRLLRSPQLQLFLLFVGSFVWQLPFGKIKILIIISKNEFNFCCVGSWVSHDLFLVLMDVFCSYHQQLSKSTLRWMGSFPYRQQLPAIPRTVIWKCLILFSLESFQKNVLSVEDNQTINKEDQFFNYKLM